MADVPYTWRDPEPTVSDNWMAPGPYVGQGPTGYRRSDERIVEDVCHRLTLHGHIDASDIEVGARDGIVILRGRVADRPQKRAAERVADTVAGVRDVRNELKLGGSQR